MQREFSPIMEQGRRRQLASRQGCPIRHRWSQRESASLSVEYNLRDVRGPEEKEGDRACHRDGAGADHDGSDRCGEGQGLGSEERRRLVFLAALYRSLSRKLGNGTNQ